MTRVVTGDVAQRPDLSHDEAVEELTGQLSPGENEEDKLMRSVIEDDGQGDKGKLIEDAVNRGMGSFIPDLMFSQLVKNFKQAQQIYGDRIIRELTGYEPEAIEKNSFVPEFQRELKSRMGQKVKDLKNEGILSEEGSITDKGMKLAALVLCTEELDHLEAKGLLGEKEHNEKSSHGAQDDSSPYVHGDRFSDLDIKKTVKVAIRRGHGKLVPDDLRMFKRTAKGSVEVIYAIDASGSMKGLKIGMCKRAGVALAFKAVQNKDPVGVIVFGKTVKSTLAPTLDFMQVVTELSRVTATSETNFADAIYKSIELFSPRQDMTKHLVFITDGMPTKGENPEKDALDAISIASENKIVISMIGIDITEKASQFVEDAVIRGGGKFHVVRNVDELDTVVLEEYAGF